MPARAFFLLLTLGLLAAPGSVLAQQPAGVPAAPVSGADCPALVGLVTDENGQPLTGATVVVQGISDAFSTNSEGRYIIAPKKPVPRPAQVQISAVGYESQKLVLRDCQLPEVMLHSLPGTRFKRDGRIKKTTSTGKIR